MKYKNKVNEYNSIEEVASKLEEYAQLEGTELGEIMEALHVMHTYKYGLSEEFVKALEDEMWKQVTYVDENAEIVVEVTEVKHEITRLVWDGE